MNIVVIGGRVVPLAVFKVALAPGYQSLTIPLPLEQTCLSSSAELVAAAVSASAVTASAVTAAAATAALVAAPAVVPEARWIQHPQIQSLLEEAATLVSMVTAVAAQPVLAETEETPAALVVVVAVAEPAVAPAAAVPPAAEPSLVALALALALARVEVAVEAATAEEVAEAEPQSTMAMAEALAEAPALTREAQQRSMPLQPVQASAPSH